VVSPDKGGLTSQAGGAAGWANTTVCSLKLRTLFLRKHLTQHAQGPRFNPQYCKKLIIHKNEKIEC
jgi:hypothetical protein